MTSTSKSTEILKRDGRGRVRVPRERQEALLDEFERSGLSGAKFAALCGVKYPSFAGWVQRRKSRRAGFSGDESVAAVAEGSDRPSNWPQLPPDNRRRVVEALVEKIVVGKDDLEITFSASSPLEDMTKSQQVIEH